MTSESSQIVQLIAAVMELLQRNAAPTAATQPQPPALVYGPEDLLRTFAGEPQDDPEAFIAEVESYFQQVGEHNLTPQHCVLVAHRQLRGDAAKRNRYFKDEDTSVEELCVRLRRDYGTENQFTRLLTEFTGATLCQNDPLGEFVNRQTNLHRHLFPGSPESRIVKELIQQMPSSVRSILATLCITRKRQERGLVKPFNSMPVVRKNAAEERKDMLLTGINIPIRSIVNEKTVDGMDNEFDGDRVEAESENIIPVNDSVVPQSMLELENEDTNQPSTSAEPSTSRWKPTYTPAQQQTPINKALGTTQRSTTYWTGRRLPSTRVNPSPQVQHGFPAVLTDVLKTFNSTKETPTIPPSPVPAIDLKFGYWYTPMDKASKHLTAFARPDGATYQYTVRAEERAGHMPEVHDSCIRGLPGEICTGVTGSEPKGPIREKETLKDHPVIRRPIRCQDGVDREGPIQFRALGRTAPKATGVLVPQLQCLGEESLPSPSRLTDAGGNILAPNVEPILADTGRTCRKTSRAWCSTAHNPVKRWNQTFRAVQARWRLTKINRRLPEALERLSTRSSSPPSAVPPVVLKLEDYLPTFSGDPDYFIQRLEKYFAQPTNAHLSEEEKVRVVYKQLRGPVFKRYKAFATRDREFRAVKDRLVTHYGVEKNFTAFYETFQKSQVEKSEDFEVFCARQETLYHRLFPAASESRLVAELDSDVSRGDGTTAGRPHPEINLPQRRKQGESTGGKLAQDRAIRISVRVSRITKNVATRSLGVVYVDIVIGDIPAPGSSWSLISETTSFWGTSGWRPPKPPCATPTSVFTTGHIAAPPFNMDSRPLPELQHQFPAPHHTGFLDALRELVCVMDASAVTGNVRAVTHKIRLEKDEPFRIRPYHLNEQKIKRSESEYCSPVVLVKKKEGTGCAHVNLDDIIVFSATYEERISHLRQIFERLQEFGLRCAPGKCRFGERHLVQIRDAVPPRTKRQLQSFLGLANRLREYVPLYATIAAPLTDLLVAKKTFWWTDAAQKAFDDLNTDIDQPLLLHRPDASRLPSG
ncbi:hypothetical protein GEV33_011783 [Tenebrio molitor]|uniref:Uncharacterized protein n=1 Tax=Tenebrio molitor TaxID=7067 RepID=A0A8J6HC36_TENMO|nr:hypothetical protein GEV33_011783 [Tenebrio molitor]